MQMTEKLISSKYKSLAHAKYGDSSRVPAYDWLKKFALNFSSVKELPYSISLGFGFEASFDFVFLLLQGQHRCLFRPPAEDCDSVLTTTAFFL